MKSALNNPERCYYCNTPLNIYNRSIDHLIPLARGGENKTYNRVYACKNCNNLKMDMTVTEFNRYKELKDIYKGKELVDKCKEEGILLWTSDRRIRNKQEKERREYHRKEGK